MLGSPIHPVRRGELTVKGLGMSVEIFNSKNESVIGVPGDLVCTEPFPSMPITFWGKDGDVRYKKTYFEEREEIWTHGDLAELKPHGSGVIYGRTDNTLNPGGVRIGTAEIYNICELFKEIEDCLVFGNQINNDEEIILCLKISQNNKLDNILSKIIRSRIRENASPRHVPQKIYEFEVEFLIGLRCMVDHIQMVFFHCVPIALIYWGQLLIHVHLALKHAKFLLINHFDYYLFRGHAK